MEWIKSSFCDSASCVEVSFDDDEVLVSDSKNAFGPVLRFTHQEWDAFVAGAKAGEFDGTPE